MLDRIVDTIGLIWDYIVPYVVIMEYQVGVQLRWGKYKRVINAGFYWKIPLADFIIIEHCAITTIGLPPQSLTTKDGKTVVVKGMIKYNIEDAHTYCLKVWDAQDALVDTACGIIKETVNERSWDELREGKIDGLISRRVTSKMKEYGINVSWVTLTDMAEMKSIRLFMERGTTDMVLK